MPDPHQKLDGTQPLYHPWMHRFAVALVVATFTLLVLGGTVTSKEAGLAVPDWPTTFEHNMFTVPFDLWIGRGGIFWEHSHRLVGSFVGMLCIVMATWLWIAQSSRRWLQYTGLGLLAMVIIQGVMGGLRVTELSLTLGIIHGVTGQLFFCLTVFIAATTSQYWLKSTATRDQNTATLRRPATALSLILLAVLLVQLVLGATTRHLGAALAIPDFPTAYGRIIPPLNQQAIIEATDRIIPEELMPQADYFTPTQVALHFAHRIGAMVVMAVATVLVWHLLIGADSICFAPCHPIVGALTFLLFLQVALGISVVTSSRHPEIATAHQALGAATLATAVSLAIRVVLVSKMTQQPVVADRVDTKLAVQGADA